MPRKSISGLRAEKVAQMEELQRELAQLDAKAAERIGRLAVKAGLADIDVDDDLWVKEFKALAGRFRGHEKRAAETGKSSAGQGGASDGAIAD